MFSNCRQFELTFVTRGGNDNGILKPNQGQTYASIPIRITVPRQSQATLSRNSRIVVTKFVAKVRFGAACHCTNSAIFDAIGLSNIVDQEGFREIRNSHIDKWVELLREQPLPTPRNNAEMYGENQNIIKMGFESADGSCLVSVSLMRASSSLKTGVFEVKNMIFYVPASYQIAFELRFDSGEPIGVTPWQTVEVQPVKRRRLM